LSGEAQESTSVLVAMPVERHRFRRLGASLPTLSRALPAAQPGMIAKRKPVTALNQLLLRRTLTPILPDVLTADSLWRSELGQQRQLWYLRRRNLHYKAEVTSWSVDMRGEEAVMDKLVTERVASLKLNKRFNALLSRGTSSAKAEVTALMASPLLREGSATVIKAVVAELEKVETLDSVAVMKVGERFSQPSFGEGLARVEKSEAVAGNNRVVENIAKSGLLPELDRLSLTLPPEELKALTDELAAAGGTSDAAAVERVAKVITDKTAAVTAKPSGPVVTRPMAVIPRGITRG
jgi:hypothetical protein